MAVVTKKARKAGPSRYSTRDEARKAGEKVVRSMPVDPYGFSVWARGEDRHNVYAGPRMRARSQSMFAKVFPQQKEYADAYGIGMDLGYYQGTEEKRTFKPTPENPDRKTNIGMWQSRNSVENSGRKFKIWVKAFDLGRRDGTAIKTMHLTYRKTGKFVLPTQVSRVLTEGKTLTADAGAEEVALTGSIESVFHADGSKYFSAGAFDYAWAEAKPEKSRTTIIMMHPKAFLAMAQNIGKPDESKMAGVDKANGNFRDLPRLIFQNNGDTTATVIGHEGRHRMYFLDKKGVQRVPVMFISQPGSGPSIRWGSATGFDAVDPWPKVLKGERNSNQMPFPVSEVYPRSIVADDINYNVYGYWITDTGAFIPVDTEEHAQTARAWIKKNEPATFESLKDDDHRVYDYKAFDTLMDRGWIHVTNGRSSCEIQVVKGAVSLIALRALRRYFAESTLEKISMIVQDRNGSPIRRIVTEPNQAIEFLRQYTRRRLTALIEAAELEILADSITFEKVGTEKGRDFNGPWILDLYNMSFDTEKVSLSVKRYPKDYSAKIHISGDSKNKFGPANIRALIAFIKKKYKNVYSVYGDRITGARNKSGKLFSTARLQIRKDDTVTATDREKHYGKSLFDQGKTDYLVIYRAVPRAEIMFKPGDYVTLSKKFAIEHAEHNAAIGEPSHVIKIVADPRKVYDALNPGEYFYGGDAKRGKVFYVASENLEAISTGDDTMRRDLLASLQERMVKVEALSEEQSYTNKTKSVKLLYYANRSTPQTCKPGATVKAKAGYGKRTKIKTATPEQVAQLKAGRWVRDREDGRKATDKGAKKTKYRKWLVSSIERRLEAAGAL